MICSIVPASITLRDIVNILNFELLLEGDLDIRIYDSNIAQTSYELLGFFSSDNESSKNIIYILGKKEIDFINRLPQDKKIDMLKKYLSLDFPALVISTAGAENIPDCFIEIAKANNKNIFRSDMSVVDTVRELKFFLHKNLSTEVMYPNYTFLEIRGIGVLIRGNEDAKLGVTLDLISRGHRLITDENVIIKKFGENHLVGFNRLKEDSKKNENFFLGNKRQNKAYNITDAFGIRSTRKEKIINIVIVLEEWDSKNFYDRLGLDEEYEEILGEKILKFLIPVRKGRNLSIIIETAALNYRSKRMGLNSAEYFLKQSTSIINDNKNRGNKMETIGKISIVKVKNEFNLKVVYGEEFIEDRYIKTANVGRPSLALFGYEEFLDEDTKGIQIFSEMEFEFLETLPNDVKIFNLRKYLNFNYAIIIVTENTEIPEYFLKLAKETKTVICRASYKKPPQLVADLNKFLQMIFSPSISIHGVFVEIHGFGVLITGKSGIGKSETALELIHNKARLIADDMVKFVLDSNGDIIGKASKVPYFMEIRGLGIIDIKTLYGLGAVRTHKKLDYVIELKEYDEKTYLISSEEKDENMYMEILGKKIEKSGLYVSSGRNAATMIEFSILNLMSRMFGIESRNPNF